MHKDTIRRSISLFLTIAFAFGLIISVSPATVEAAVKYNKTDVAVINNIIAKNGLKGYKKDKPATWDFAKWKSGRVVSLNLSSRNLKGALNVSKLVNLTELYCVNNKLTSINVSTNKKLKILYCGVNRLTKLTVTNNTALTVLSCYSNRLTSLNVSKNVNLKSLECDSNKLTSLNVSKNIRLEVLFCGFNKLKALNLKGLKKLHFIDLRQNSIKTLMVANGDTLKIANSVGGTVTIDGFSMNESGRVALTIVKADKGYKFDHYESDKPLEFVPFDEEEGEGEEPATPTVEHMFTVPKGGVTITPVFVKK